MFILDESVAPVVFNNVFVFLLPFSNLKWWFHSWIIVS